MSHNMRESMRRLGDFPADRTAQERARSSETELELGLRRKSAYESQNVINENDFLTQQREANESTVYHSQLHPVHDNPFFGQNIIFSSGQQLIVPGTTDGLIPLLITPNDGVIPSRHVGFVRSIDVAVFDATAEDDLRITVRVNNAADHGTLRLRPSAFLNFRNNCYYRIMQNQAIDVLVTNLSAVFGHQVRIEAQGWFYPVADVKETSRGVLPRTK